MRKLRTSKNKIVKINKEKILSEIKKEIGKNTYLHKFGHYCFECECHPDDSAEELEKKMWNLHLS